MEPHRGFILHDDDTIAEKHPVMPGLYLSVTLDALAPLLQNPLPRVRFCLGYAGWGPQQLEQEMAAGSWLFAEAVGRAHPRGQPRPAVGRDLEGDGRGPGHAHGGKGTELMLDRRAHSRAHPRGPA